MDLMIRLQVYIVSFFVLFIIYIQLKEESQSYSLHDRLFRYLVLCTMAIIVFEAIGWVFDGRPGGMAGIINWGSNTLALVLDTIPLILWTLYIIVSVCEDRKLVFKGLIVMGVLASINILMALSAPFNHGYFYIDTNNIYHRGEWRAISACVHGLLFGANLLVVARSWGEINQRDRVPILFFLVPPVLGFVGQSMFYGTSLTWAGVTISILMGYIMIQTQRVKIDYLTGLYNRRQLDYYMERRIRNLPYEKKFAGMMIDLNDFKGINDEYGHVVGDKAIKTAASLIKKSFKREHFVARYGGDEFVVIFDIKNEGDVTYKLNRLEEQFELFNKEHEEVFELKYSVGYGIYDVGDGTGDEFLHRLDGKMYANKKRRKMSTGG